MHDFDLNESLLNKLCVYEASWTSRWRFMDDYVTTAPKRKSVQRPWLISIVGRSNALRGGKHRRRWQLRMNFTSRRSFVVVEDGEIRCLTWISKHSDSPLAKGYELLIHFFTVPHRWISACSWYSNITIRKRFHSGRSISRMMSIPLRSSTFYYYYALFTSFAL